MSPGRDAPDTDWLAWHEPYADPDSPLSQRLAAAVEQVVAALDRAPSGPVQLLSLCAGQGLDVLPVLATHPRGADVSGRLVELDPRNCALARQAAPDRIEVLEADAGLTTCADGATPADLLLLCGIFGNVDDADVERTLRAIPSLCAPAATVLWTRSRHAPDLTPAMRACCAEVGLEEVAFSSPGSGSWSVYAGVFRGEPEPFVADRRLFTFSTRPPG